MLGTYERLGVHVHASNREVISAARLKLQPQCRSGVLWRKARHEFYRVMLGYHNDARVLVREWRL